MVISLKKFNSEPSGSSASERRAHTSGSTLPKEKMGCTASVRPIPACLQIRCSVCCSSTLLLCRDLPNATYLRPPIGDERIILLPCRLLSRRAAALSGVLPRSSQDVVDMRHSSKRLVDRFRRARFSVAVSSKYTSDAVPVNRGMTFVQSLVRLTALRHACGPHGSS